MVNANSSTEELVRRNTIKQLRETNEPRLEAIWNATCGKDNFTFNAINEYLYDRDFNFYVDNPDKREQMLAYINDETGEVKKPNGLRGYDVDDSPLEADEFEIVSCYEEWTGMSHYETTEKPSNGYLWIIFLTLSPLALYLLSLISSLISPF